MLYSVDVECDAIGECGDDEGPAEVGEPGVEHEAAGEREVVPVVQRDAGEEDGEDDEGNREPDHSVVDGEQRHERGVALPGVVAQMLQTELRCGLVVNRQGELENERDEHQEKTTPPPRQVVLCVAPGDLMSVTEKLLLRGRNQVRIGEIAG